MATSEDEMKRTLRPRRSGLPCLQAVLPQENITERMKACHVRLKETPDNYRDYRKSETERVKAYRKPITEEKKAETKEGQKLYTRKYREKQKKENTFGSNTSDKKAVTHQEKKFQVDKWKERKQAYRRGLTKIQRDALNKRRRDKYALDKANTLLSTLMPTATSTNSSPDVIINAQPTPLRRPQEQPPFTFSQIGPAPSDL